MPKLLSAGGKSVREELTHKEVPPAAIRGESKPAIKPLVAVVSSFLSDKNSWTAPRGNDAFGKASFIEPKPTSTPTWFEGLKPCKRRISVCNSAIISALFSSFTIIGLEHPKIKTKYIS